MEGSEASKRLVGREGRRGAEWRSLGGGGGYRQTSVNDNNKKKKIKINCTCISKSLPNI